MRTRACLFCLLAVSVYADRTRFLHICTDQVDSSANPPSVFPCLEVDPCISLGNYVPKNGYINVGTKIDWTNPAQTEAPYHEHIYENSIQRVRVPTGVTLWVVQFDFTQYTSNANLYNKLDETTEMKIIGDCTDTTDSNCDDFPEQTGSRIIPGGLQVFAWSLSTGYSCTHTTVAPGKILEPPTPPNIIAECPAIHGSIWVEGDCIHTCQTDYTANGDTCEPTCAVSWPEECGSRQRSTASNNCINSVRYKCEDCYYENNKQALDWTAENHDSCSNEDCAPHHYSRIDGVCLPCPVNEERPATQHACSPCGSWKHTQNKTGHACVDCFLENTDKVCPQGMRRVVSVDGIYDYFDEQTHAGDYTDEYFNERLFCEQNYACLPCKPGYYMTSQTMCEQCPLGKYQPNYAATVCFDCGSGKHTIQISRAIQISGSRDVSSCICDRGYEEIA